MRTRTQIIGGVGIAAGLVATGGALLLTAPAPDAPELGRIACWMGGPGVPVVADPPAGWTPCGTSPSGQVTLYVSSPAECLAPLTVAPGTPVEFVDGRAAQFDLDGDGDVDLADYAAWSRAASAN